LLGNPTNNPLNHTGPLFSLRYADSQTQIAQTIGPGDTNTIKLIYDDFHLTDKNIFCRKNKKDFL